MWLNIDGPDACQESSSDGFASLFLSLPDGQALSRMLTQSPNPSEPVILSKIVRQYALLF